MRSKGSRLLAAFVVACVLSGISVWMTSGEHAEENGPSHDGAPRVRVEHVKFHQRDALGQDDEASGSLDSRNASKAASGAASLRAGLSARRDPAQHEQYYKALHTAQQELLSKAFEDDPVDPAWRVEAEGLLLRAYAEAEFTGIVVDAECRKALCRVRFNYSGAREQRVIERFLAKRPWSGRGYVQYDTEKMDGVAYFARQGFSLPRVDRNTLAL